MQYKREEGFRYVFGEPLLAEFSIEHIDGKSTNSKPGNAKIIDISPKGAKITSKLQIPMEKGITISLSFTLNEKKFMIISDIVWRKELFGEYQYGLESKMTNEEQNHLVNELKIYAKGN